MIEEEIKELFNKESEVASKLKELDKIFFDLILDVDKEVIIRLMSNGTSEPNTVFLRLDQNSGSSIYFPLTSISSLIEQLKEIERFSKMNIEELRKEQKKRLVAKQI